jgi:membrane protease YdiL (CAAX protease family)
MPHFGRRHRFVTFAAAWFLLITSAVSVTEAFSTQPSIIHLTPTSPVISYPLVATTTARRMSFRKRFRLHNKVSPEDTTDNTDYDEHFNGRTTIALVGGQTLLVVAAMGAAVIVGTPNFGFGPGIDFSVAALQLGTLLAVPLGALAAGLDLVEDRYPALQDVTKATQRSVLALMGGTFKPVLALATAVALGVAAGFGEEMLFRGVFQYEIASRFGTAMGVATASIVFGLLHSVTPLYAVLAAIASVYFGAIYVMTDNLAIPIACHTIYDIGALFYAHWTVSQLPLAELKALARWEGPGSDSYK